jgi:hypothetical protein
VSLLRADPLPWLLEEGDPAVRHLALRLLLDLPIDDPAVGEARAAAMRSKPIQAILDAQHPDGYWVKPGPGYGPKFKSTVWQVIFLDQLGADALDPQIQAACEYVLTHTQSASGGFGMSGREDAEPSPSSVVHCLNGNLVRALIGFGRLDDARLQRAIDWQARAINGDADVVYYRSGTSGPGFSCAINDAMPCAWGAIKALRGLARIPEERRAPTVQRAIASGRDFLLGRDPAVADYPAGVSGRVSANWFKLGFPSGYIADVLQNLETLCELGAAADPRLRPGIDWLLARQDAAGRWHNTNSYRGRTWVSFDVPHRPSKWVTLRACTVLKAVAA